MVASFKKNDIADELMPSTLYAAEAEEAVLGQVLINPELLEKISQKLIPDTFHFWQHQEIYRAMLQLQEEGKPADLMNVAMYLCNTGKLEQVGGQSKLAQLCDRTDYHEIVYLPQRIELILETYKKRQTWKLQHLLREKAADRFTSTEEIVTELQEQIAKISSGENLLSPLDRIAKISRENLSPSQREWQLKKLSDELGLKSFDFQKLVERVELDLLVEEEKPESQKNLQALIAAQTKKLNVRDYLWGDGGKLAEAISKTARAMPTAPEFIFSSLIPVAASRIGTSSRIIVSAAAKYKQPCIFWTAIVARSGRAKTPVQSLVTEPLIEMEIDANNRYKQELADWEALEDKTEPKPTRRRFITTDITTETLDRIHGENPRGLLYYRDELAGMLKARNQYKRGTGSDEESEISQFSGGALISDRKERSTCLEKTAVSRTGSIQWDVAQEILNQAKDGNGGICRWLFCAADAPPRLVDLNQSNDTGISELLGYLYRSLGELPETDYLLSIEAKGIFQKWQHELVHREISEKRAGFNLVYPKIESYTARFALWLHCVNAVLAGKIPEVVIDAETMTKAIALAKWFLGQAELVYGVNSDESLTGDLLRLYNFAKGKDRLTPSDIKRNSSWFKKRDTAAIKQLMQQLADDGYGQFDGKSLIVSEKLVEVGGNWCEVGEKLVTPPTSKTLWQQELQEKIGKKVGEVGEVGAAPNSYLEDIPYSSPSPEDATNFTNFTNFDNETITESQIEELATPPTSPPTPTNFDEEPPKTTQELLDRALEWIAEAIESNASLIAVDAADSLASHGRKYKEEGRAQEWEMLRQSVRGCFKPDEWAKFLALAEEGRVLEEEIASEDLGIPPSPAPNGTHPAIGDRISEAQYEGRIYRNGFIASILPDEPRCCICFPGSSTLYLTTEEALAAIELPQSEAEIESPKQLSLEIDLPESQPKSKPKDNYEMGF